MNHLIFTSTLMVIDYKQHSESKPGKPQTPEIFLECYCFANKKKQTRHEKTEPQARMLISLWFCSLFACPDLCCDWA